ncbi:MAG: tRNA (N6-threonylcarbamoyladenosine(37)-N6)-methyltransferase TrmO [Candidatus Bathyarchaeota archaeon]|nr:tRNA (N6-threonylcarbamoyladenosine(37)-N6)-methyltransferase TrmO [Candidatus Bathyarchaeota archaeon]MDH5786734.1 tRNA (N6-threonylcarbamoyladenosine(37)-N6)-methyltransferase TrmO [Candidatus Bathyarchaeota archaeon]
MDVKGELRFIGVVEKAGEEEGKIRIFPEFCAGLKGIDGFSHLIILYWIHLRDNEEERRTLRVFPRKHEVHVETGVFACRSPSRPNPIGLCVVELLKIEGCVLTVKELDAFVESPIVDIKPYIPRADSIPSARVPDWTWHGPKT